MSNLSAKAVWNKYYVTNDQVLALINMWKEAPIYKKEKIQGIILERLSYLVYARIKGYRGRSFYGDLIQEGNIGLLKAMQEFNQERGLNFFKVAVWHIRSQIRQYLRGQKRYERQVRKQEKVLSSSFQETSAPSPHEYYEEKEGKEVLESVLNKLPHFEGNVLRMRYGICGSEKHTLQQIGDIFSVSRQYVQQIESKVMSKLKNNRQIKELYMA